MNNVYLNEESISQIFWKNINAMIHTHFYKDKLEDIWEATNKIRNDFPPDIAGTIDKQTALELIAISKFFSPKRVCEIGTYIGRSAFCIATGAKNNLIELHTCDYSFDLFKITDELLKYNRDLSKIIYYGKTSSTEMFRQLQVNKNAKIDLFFLDGRISHEDNDLIDQIKNQNSVFILDDYEGTEKGVHNAFMLRQKFKDLILIRPSITMLNFDCYHGKLAMLVPIANFKISRQQYMPNNVWI